MLRISAGLGLRIFRASGLPGLRAIRMLRITAGLRRVFFLHFEYSGLVLRFGLMVFRVLGFRSTRTLGSSAGLGLRVSGLPSLEPYECLG